MEMPNLNNTISLEEKQNKLIEKIRFGKAIIFTGAGFSYGMKNIDDQLLPFAKELAHEICKLGKIDEDDDLSYAADAYIENPELNNNLLINLLEKKLTVKEVKKEHETITSIPWKRYYTTNYDNGLSIAALKNNIKIRDIDLSDETELYYRGDSDICIHINGMLDRINTSNIHDAFKLSSKSYLSKYDFFKSEWFSVFKQDLTHASAIVFVGYSLYDEFIEKILFWENSSDLKDKTFFITEKKLSKRDEHKFKKYGQILPIETKGFGDLIQENLNNIQIQKHMNSDDNLINLKKYQMESSDKPIIPSDKSIEDIFLHGKLNQNDADNFISYLNIKKMDNNSSFMYLLPREDKLQKVTDYINLNKNIVLFSELGNGKTIFLKLLKPYLAIKTQKEILFFDCFDASFQEELEFLSKQQKNYIIFIDDFSEKAEIINYFKILNPSNIQLVISERSYNHLSLDIENKTEVYIDELDDDSIHIMLKIIDNLGFWEKLHYTYSEKLEYLQKDCKRYISLILLDIFKSPAIKDKISEIVDPLMTNKDKKKTIFVISLLSILNQSDKIDISIISDLSDNFLIFNDKLTNSNEFNYIFNKNKGYIEVRSSLFCLNLIRNYFSYNDVVNYLFDIADFLNNNRDNFKNRELLKTILRFSTIERLFSEKNKRQSLRNFYDGVKKRIQWLDKDPHFWLQYAMSYIMLKEYPTAQKYLDNAFNFAEQKSNDKGYYHLNDFNTQQARLWLLVGKEKKHDKEILSYFEKATNLLDRIPKDKYKYRQVSLYIDFYKESKIYLSKNNQNLIIKKCKEIINEIDELSLDIDGYSFITNIQEKLTKFIDNIN